MNLKKENLIKNWFHSIKKRTENIIIGSNLTEEELKSIDESEKADLGEDLKE